MGLFCRGRARNGGRGPSLNRRDGLNGHGVVLVSKAPARCLSQLVGFFLPRFEDRGPRNAGGVSSLSRRDCAHFSPPCPNAVLSLRCPGQAFLSAWSGFSCWDYAKPPAEEKFQCRNMRVSALCWAHA
jgi:hypothetical protein